MERPQDGRAPFPPSGLCDESVNGMGPSLWDNTDLAESFSGVTSPLTFSFAAHAYQHIFRQFCQVMGVPTRFLGRRINMFEGMLGFVRGRLYCNVVNWHRIAHLLPWFGMTPDQGLDVLGARSMRDIVDESALSAEARASLSSLFDVAYKAPHYSSWDHVRLAWLGLWRFIRLDCIVADFQRHFESVFTWAKNLEFRSRPLPEQLAAYRYLDRQLLRQWSAPIINDAFYFAFFALLKRLSVRWMGLTPSAAVVLQNDLLCGQRDLQSLEPTKMLMRIAAYVDTEAPLVREWLLASPTSTIVAAMSQPPPHAAAFVTQVRAFIALHGFRCADELKLEAQDFHLDASFVVRAITRFVRTKHYATHLAARERVTHHRAKAQVHAALGGWRRFVYFKVLQYLSQTLGHREQLRFLRTQAVGIVRHLFLAMGDNLAALGAIDAPRDVFYLTCDEVFAYIEGRALTTHMQPLVAARREAFAQYAQTPSPPRRFVSYGSGSASMAWPHVLDAGSLDDSRFDVDAVDGTTCLSGTPCSAGIVEARVRLAHDLLDAEEIDNEILVAQRTDPAWVPLYPACKGLLLAQGSLLSHTSAAARELGLPTIVGLGGGLMRQLRTGMRIRMNGQTGEVTILAGHSSGHASHHRAAG